MKVISDISCLPKFSGPKWSYFVATKVYKVCFYDLSSLGGHYWFLPCLNFHFSGGYRDPIHFCYGLYELCYSLSNDWIWVDIHKVLPLPFLPVLHGSLLDILWNDGHRNKSESSSFFCNFWCPLHNMESLHRLCHSPEGSFLLILVVILLASYE